MSNFNREAFPPDKINGEIVCGPEVVNGTGQVYLGFETHDGHAIFLLDYETVLELAGWLADHAFEAMRVQWRERNLMSG